MLESGSGAGLGLRLVLGAGLGLGLGLGLGSLLVAFTYKVLEEVEHGRML